MPVYSVNIDDLPLPPLDSGTSTSPEGSTPSGGYTPPPSGSGWEKRGFRVGDEVLRYYSKPKEARIFIPTEELDKISLLSKEAAVMLREQSR